MKPSRQERVPKREGLGNPRRGMVEPDNFCRMGDMMADQNAALKIKELNIGIVGAGVMGRALIKGMTEAGLVTRDHIFAAVGRRASRQRLEGEGFQVSLGYAPEWVSQTDIFLLCTKPHTVAKALAPILAKGELKANALFISVAAGLTLEKLEAMVPGYPVIRAMPNTPCLVGAGITVISMGSHADEHHAAVAKQIFCSVGECLELAETHLDAVTAVSGSGPAYIYLILESLADGAVKVGLPRGVALRLVAQTMLGSAIMLQETGKHPAMLKDEVTTPAGCTISALLTLEDGKIRSTLARAVEEATRTAATLG